MLEFQENAFLELKESKHKCDINPSWNGYPAFCQSLKRYQEFTYSDFKKVKDECELNPSWNPSKCRIVLDW